MINKDAHCSQTIFIFNYKLTQNKNSLIFKMSKKSSSNQSWEFSDRTDSQRLAEFITSAGNVISILLEEGISGNEIFSRIILAVWLFIFDVLEQLVVDIFIKNGQWFRTAVL